MANVTIKGKDNVEKYFKGQKLPYWKVYREDDKRINAGNNLVEKNIGNSARMFLDLLDTIDPDNNYVLSMYPHLTDKTQLTQQTFREPASEVTFNLSGKTQVSGIIDPAPGQSAKSDFKGSMSIESYMHLIAENARLIAKEAYSDGKITELKEKVEELESEVKHLNTIIDDYEEEEEEEIAEEEKAMGSVPEPETLSTVLTGLLKEHGPAIVSQFTKGKGGKINPGAYTPPIEMDGNIHDPAHVTGINKTPLPDLNIIIKQLQGIDPDLHQHLFKLLLVAQQQPSQFKTFITYLENM